MKFDWKSSVRSPERATCFTDRPYTLHLSARWIISNFPCGELHCYCPPTIPRRSFEITRRAEKERERGEKEIVPSELRWSINVCENLHDSFDSLRSSQYSASRDRFVRKPCTPLLLRPVDPVSWLHSAKVERGGSISRGNERELSIFVRTAGWSVLDRRCHPESRSESLFRSIRKCAIRKRRTSEKIRERRGRRE